MAKPPSFASPEEGEPLQVAKVENIDYKDAALLRSSSRPRQDPRPPRDRCLGPGAAPHRQRRQERPEMALLPYSSSGR